jgi:Peptidase C13 family
MSSAAVLLADLLRNLRAGLRLALLLRVAPQAFVATAEQLIALVCVDVLSSLLSDMAYIGLDGRLNPWGLPGALFYLPLLLLASYVIARREKDIALLLLLPVCILAAGQYVTLATTALTVAADRGWLDLSARASYGVYYWGPYLWWLLIAATSVLRLTSRPVPVKLQNALVIALLLFVPLWFLPRSSTGPLWTQSADDPADADDDDARAYASASEEALYAQPDILRRSLSALAPGREGVEDLYFVGVAGYAREDVFRKELSVIEPLFEQRFGTRARSVSLINNPDTALQAPIASVSGLQKTLNRIGHLMNRDEDVLFLYLTSHGSEEHRLTLDFWPLRLHDLDGPTLRRLLDVSGIRWRVIVISACYSGGFIEPLEDEHTLIVTASDATHVSFGCGSESDFTYFGKAYFDEALRATRSFTAAFEAARRMVEARERAEAMTPSNPQMYVGARMAEKLRGLERRWDRDNAVKGEE